MIGHYTDYYSEVAQQMGTQYFDVRDDWNSMTEAELWAANQSFLDNIMSQGGTFELVTPLGSYLQQEIQYLTQHGYKVGCNGRQLLPPG